MENLLLERLIEGNRRYLTSDTNPASFAPALRRATAENGQTPHTVVVCCSDSRVVPESIFSAGLGELFVIRVAGNVLGAPQIGSIEYAAAHLGCKLIVVLGHTQCGAVGAALSGHCEGYVRCITDEILRAVGGERDPLKACRLNVLHGVDMLREAFHEHPEIPSADLILRGAVYDVRSGEVEWL